MSVINFVKSFRFEDIGNLLLYKRANGPELSCGDVPMDCRRMLARVVMCHHLVNSFRAAKKTRRTFRQLERVVRAQRYFCNKAFFVM